MNQARPDESLARVFREEAGRVLASLIASFGDFDLAEDALQDAVAQALEAWRRAGPPRRPGAWLLTVARRRAVDRLRRDAQRHQKAAALAVYEREARSWHDFKDGEAIPDERLRLVFTCCHPALRRELQVALTLKTLGGLNTRELARAFLVPDATMAQRLARAKQKIRAAGIPYRVPAPEALPARLEAVQGVLYLIFNEGYAATEGASPTRADLCAEALRLADILRGLLRHPENDGLYALMTLHDARRPGRVDATGAIVPLDRQDRALWDGERIAEGTALLRRVLAFGQPGAYQIQAAISALHAEAPNAEATDWRQIAGLYAALAERAPSPIVLLNWELARSRVESPARALEQVEALRGELHHYQPFHAARADLLRRLGRSDEARAAYRDALALTTNRAEQRFLETRVAELAEPESPGRARRSV